MKIVLGSASMYRASQLRQLGIAFEQIAPDIDEDAYKQKIPNPVVLALMLAEAKADAVKEKLSSQIAECDFANNEYIIIASDQLVAVDNEILGKPYTSEKAVEQLLKLGGREHSLITALTVLKISQEKVLKKSDAVIQSMTMYPISKKQAEAYIAKQNVLNCSGSYQIEGFGLTLFEKIVGEDFTSIIGLPMLKLVKFLREFDYFQSTYLL